MARSSTPLTGISKQLLEYFRAHPGAIMQEAIAVMGASKQAAHNARARLSKLGLLEACGETRRPYRWRTVDEAAPRAAPELPRITVSPESAYRPTQATGMPYQVVDGVIHPRSGALQVFNVDGPRTTEPQYSHRGSSNEPGAAHPWGWGNSKR